MTNTSSLLDMARGAAEQAVAGAQDALSAAQTKLAAMSRASEQDDLLAALGAAFYDEQRSGGTKAAVDSALVAVDAHVAEYGWRRETGGPLSAADAASVFEETDNASDEDSD